MGKNFRTYLCFSLDLLFLKLLIYWGFTQVTQERSTNNDGKHIDYSCPLDLPHTQKGIWNNHWPRIITPRKTNMSPENQWLEDVFPFYGTCGSRHRVGESEISCKSCQPSLKFCALGWGKKHRKKPLFFFGFVVSWGCWYIEDSPRCHPRKRSTNNDGKHIDYSIYSSGIYPTPLDLPHTLGSTPHPGWLLPEKLTNVGPLKTNGWFRCISYWNSSFFGGPVSFRGCTNF